MSYKALHKAFVSLIATLLFAFSFASAVHAAEHGDAPHEHDEVVCALCVVSDDAQVWTPFVFENTVLDVSAAVPEFTVFSHIIYMCPQGCAPPVRGPPLHFEI